MALVRRLAALLALLLVALPAAAQELPKFTGFVVDAANVLPPAVEADLTQKLSALQRDTKRQLVVATIPDLQGYPIEEYGIKLLRGWQVGLADVDNGAILIVAPNDRKVRVEVGYGLEPFLTDAFSSTVINQTILPQFKAGDIAGGTAAGADALIAQLRASPEEAQARLDAAVKRFDETQGAGARRSGGGLPIGLIIMGMIVVFIALSFVRRGIGGGQPYRGPGLGASRRARGSGIGSVILWNIAANVAAEALRSRGGSGGGGWGGGDGGGGGGWGGGGFGGGGGGSGGGGGASGSW